MIRELPDIDARASDINRQIREESDQSSIPGQKKEKIIVERKISDNSYFLHGGGHGGISISKPNTNISGSPGTVVTGLTKIGDSSRFTGIHFKRKVEVTSSSATVIFTGCRFDTTDSNSVSLVEGAKVIVIGSSFTSAPTGDVINNPGGAPTQANAQLIGCSNKTGQPIGNVTQTAVLT
mgnify:CR=1 FL=1